MRTRFEVSKEDISHGIREDCTACPVARSIFRAGFRPQGVGLDEVVFSIATGIVVIDLQPAVSSRIAEFDKTGKMEPFSFDLIIPPEVIKYEQSQSRILG